ncbi:hypothetical protein ACH3O9_06070 [Leeuwenhoekiella sp. A16]|uniref:hypothetical protein n=1 Tax=unclassified Leeuwenhoekiella TaxID=2615029 RepID=UPI000C615C88|nr:hypothetical protein [Pseudooceanicola sp.]
MKNQSFKLMLLCGLFAIIPLCESYAQESGDDKKMAYYEQRAKQDAAFERSYKAESEAEEEAFWKEQHKYEENLKKEDEVAYKAYMRGKRDAYKEHKKHCDHHCHHSEHYYSEASFYYYSNNRSYYKPAPRSTIRTDVRINTPNVRIGF